MCPSSMRAPEWLAGSKAWRCDVFGDARRPLARDPATPSPDGMVTLASGGKLVRIDGAARDPLPRDLVGDQ